MREAPRSRRLYCFCFFHRTALADPAIVVTARTGTAPARLTGGVVDRARHALSVDAQGNTYVVQQTVPQISTTPSVTGQPYQVQIAVRGKVGRPAGAVQLSSSDGQHCSITLVDGDGGCEPGNANAGAVTLTAAFTSAAPTLFADSTHSSSHTVNKAQTQLSLSAAAWSHPGDSISVQASLSVAAPGAGTPGGTIQIGDGVDSCSVTSPVGSCTLNLSTPGPRTLSASYAGDADFLAASASAAHRVNRAPVTGSDSYAMNQDGSLTLAAAGGVLGNDSDADGDTLGLDGRLGYVLSGRGGSATVQVRAQDSGGTDEGGVDSSPAQSLAISVASGVDLGVSVTSDDRFLRNGSISTHRVSVSSRGPDPALQAVLSVPRPANLTGFAWTCTRSDAQACSVASGSGAITQNLDLPLGVTVHYQISATVIAVPEMPVVLSAGVTAGAGQTELQPTTNTAAHSTPVGIFAAGFEQ